MLRPTQLIVIGCIFVVFATAPVAAQQRALGVFGLWGAFQDPGRCYAISRPTESTIRGTRPFATVAFWGRRVPGQVHFRLSGEMRPASAVLLRVGERTFQLTGGGWDAWSPGGPADAELLVAMRSALDMVVETRSARGGLVRDRYTLRGAPSAIDAAAVACAA